jgi:hypothetical protein
MDVSELGYPPDSRYCIIIITSDCALVLYVFVHNVSSNVAARRQQIVACFPSFRFPVHWKTFSCDSRETSNTRVVIQDFSRYAQLLEPFAETVNDVAKHSSVTAL